MKKLLGILVLGLLWCNVGFAKILILNCADASSAFEKKEIKIDTSLKIINLFDVFTDDWMKDSDPKPSSKMSIVKYNLIYFDGNYAKGQRFFVYQGENRKAEIDIDLKKKTEQTFFTYGDGYQSSGQLHKCK